MSTKHVHLKNPSECPPRYGMGTEMKRFQSHRRHLNKILVDTQKALQEVHHLELFPLESQILDIVRVTREKLARPPSLVVMGPARARLVNFLLGEMILPSKDPQNDKLYANNGSPTTKGWRWLRIQYGIKKQIRLSFGSDIEVVEPSLIMDSAWKQIPYQILKRNDVLDLSTVMDIDLCHPLLEQGLQILVPPDLSDTPMNEHHTLLSDNSTDSNTHELFFTKRGSLLENVFPIIIYALDHLDETIDFSKVNVKPNTIGGFVGDMDKCKSTNDFFSMNLRNSGVFSSFTNTNVIRDMNKDESDSNKVGNDTNKNENDRNSMFYVNLEKKATDIDNKLSSNNTEADLKSITNGESCSNLKNYFVGLSDENLLDLRQIHELHPTAQVLFTFFTNNQETSKNINQLPMQSKMNHNEYGSSTHISSFKNNSFEESPLDNRCMRVEYGTTYTTSECSSFTSHISEYMKNFSPLECEKLHVVAEGNNRIDSKSVLPDMSKESQQGIDGYEDENQATKDERFMASSLDSMVFIMDDDKDKILDRQRTYLAALVEQLGQMTHPLSKNKFTAHWLILDDSQTHSQSINDTSRDHLYGDSRKYKPSSSGDSQSCGVLQRDDFIYSLVNFTKGCLLDYILDDCHQLSDIHNALLQQFILSSFDMAREMQIIPKRIQYVASMERLLYNKLIEKFTGLDKRDELNSIIEKVLQDMKNTINSMDWAGPNCRGSKDCLNMNKSVFYRTENNKRENIPTSIQLKNPYNSTPQLSESELSLKNYREDILDNITKEILKEYHCVESLPKARTYNVPAEEVKENNPYINQKDENLCRNITFGYPTMDGKKLNTKLENGLVENNSMLESNLKLTSQLENPFNAISKNRKSECSSTVTSGCGSSSSKLEDKINLNVEVLKGVNSTDSGNFSHDSAPNDSGCTKVSFKQASLDVQRIVLAKLSRNISIQLVNYVDCLRDSYFGTLQRCLETLEEGQKMRPASEAVRRILLVTRSVNLQQCASFSFLNVLVDHIRRFFQRLSIGRSGSLMASASIGGISADTSASCCVNSPNWRRQVAHQTIDSLNADKLNKIIVQQLKDRIRVSHEQFQSALVTLSENHTVRLQVTEDLKIVVRKRYAPRFARLYLESTSLVDLVKFGLPHVGKEIGRGQYGVVYAIKGSWAGQTPLAVKSVVPPDNKHFNELAMEFFHTRNIPPHDRIVHLLGSVIDYTYGGGVGQPAVLLISEKLKWDLHCALAHGSLSFVKRMQIAVDIVEGIRYLHSLGLVHRDIKLKNVLLDDDSRAKLTDLGFCIPEAMISGSVVGTPVHMAPELLNGVYDYSVDVYAFGILFWFVCAGQARLPSAFEHFRNKEQLWINVKRGLRPEQLPIFSDICWDLMQNCWSPEPSLRPLLGDIQPILEDARDHPNKHIFGYIPD